VGYDTEIVTNVEKKVVTVNGKKSPFSDFIQILEEAKAKVRIEKKKQFID
jgi:hypothetical protein